MISSLLELNFRLLGFWLCLGVYPILAVVAWRSGLEGPRKPVVILWCAVSLGWAWALGWKTTSPSQAWTAVICDVGRPASWLGFLLVLPASAGAFWNRFRRRLGIRDMVILGSALAITGIAFLAVAGHGPAAAGAFWQVLVCIATLLVLENLFGNAAPDNRWGMQMFCIGFGLQALYDLFFFVNLLLSGSLPDLRFLSARGYFAATGALFILAALLREPAWRGEITLSRKVVFHFAALIGTGFYLVATSLAGESLRLYGGNWGSALEMAFLLAAAIILFTVLESDSVRARLVVFLSKHFFRMRYDYRNVWLTFIRRMANPDAGSSLSQRTLQAAAEAIGCRTGALWGLDRDAGVYAPRAMQNFLHEGYPLVPAEDSLPRFLQRTNWTVDIRQYLDDAGVYGDLDLPDWLTRLLETEDAWIVVPLIHNQILEAFLVLGPPDSGRRPLKWEDFDVLRTVGAQGASYLAEERVSHLLTDAEKLKDFNRRFAFALHDIKNIVGQMAMMMQNAERFGDNPEFQKDMLFTVGNSVDRLRGLLTRLKSDFATSPDERHDFDLIGVLEHVSARWKRSFPNLEFVRGLDSVAVSGTEGSVITALDHLIQNAIEAAPEGHVRLAVSAGDAEAQIEIADDGPGMTPEFIRDQLFRPLETSKATGSGLGAYQALMAVRGMGGRLEVASEPGKGTRFRMIYPRADGMKAKAG